MAYLTNADIRAQLLCYGFKLRGIQLNLMYKKSVSPYLKKEDKVETTRVYVRQTLSPLIME